MTGAPRIAIDAMGGDEGIATMMDGVARARRAHDGISFLLVGDETQIKAGLKRHPNLTAASEILHVDGVVESDEKPSAAIRRSARTSMGLAINAVKRGDAQAAVSSGNTGAMMAMAKLALRTMPGIERPALAAMLPTLGETDVVMLDLGANTECDTENLVQFAVMGAAYARIGLGLAKPRVRLLNIGTEAMKGKDMIRDAAQILRDAPHLPMDFQGFIEGDQVARGEVDVVVSDGFSGNIALKTAEGTARFVTDLLRRSFTSSFRSKAGFLLSKPALHMLKHHLDPNNHNGAIFLGLNGIVVKSHGGADEIGVANAVDLAVRLAEQDLLRRIASDLDQFHAAPARKAPATVKA